LYCAAEISGAQFRTKCASGRANFGNVQKKRALSKSTAFIRASEKLLHNISSSSAHLESEESMSVRAAHKKTRERKKMRTGKREKQARMRNLRETEFEMHNSRQSCQRCKQ
jgi:hypothetical protein